VAYKEKEETSYNCKCCKECEEKCHEKLCIEKLHRGFLVTFKCKDYAFEELCDVIEYLREVYEKEHGK
jgi:hypothetical protein